MHATYASHHACPPPYTPPVQGQRVVFDYLMYCIATYAFGVVYLLLIAQYPVLFDIPCLLWLSVMCVDVAAARSSSFPDELAMWNSC